MYIYFCLSINLSLSCLPSSSLASKSSLSSCRIFKDLLAANLHFQCELSCFEMKSYQTPPYPSLPSNPTLSSCIISPSPPSPSLSPSSNSDGDPVYSFPTLGRGLFKKLHFFSRGTSSRYCFSKTPTLSLSHILLNPNHNLNYQMWQNIETPNLQVFWQIYSCTR